MPLPLRSTGPEDLGALLFSKHGQLLGGAGLADARLAHQHHQPSVTGNGVVQGNRKLAHFPLAADENVA